MCVGVGGYVYVCGYVCGGYVYVCGCGGVICMWGVCVSGGGYVYVCGCIYGGLYVCGECVGGVMCMCVGVCMGGYGVYMHMSMHLGSSMCGGRGQGQGFLSLSTFFS